MTAIRETGHSINECPASPLVTNRPRTLPDARAAETIEALAEPGRCFGSPRTIRVDHGRQFTSKELDLWAYANNVALDFSQSRRPVDNASAKSFNARVRMERLGQHWFLDLDDARLKVEAWRREYNEVRPHSAIGERPPMAQLSALGTRPEDDKGPEALS